jgi:hypothetical protein
VHEDIASRQAVLSVVHVTVRHANKSNASIFFLRNLVRNWHEMGKKSENKEAKVRGEKNHWYGNSDKLGTSWGDRFHRT